MYKLRELNRYDIPKINVWRNDPELIALLGAPFRYINEEIDIKWFENYMSNRGNAVRCAITQINSDEILGLASLTSIDYLNQSAEFQIMIGNESNQGKGIGTYAVNMMLSHAFYNMNLQRVSLSVLEDNYRAIHVYNKVGFIQEGRKRKARYKNGRFVDILEYSILKEEYSCKTNICGGGGGLPDYTIASADIKEEKEFILKVCAPFLFKSITNNINYGSIQKKVITSADVYFAYNTKILGFIVFYANDNSSNISYISMFAVNPEYRNKHIGTRLLENSFITAANRGMTKVKLEVDRQNIDAITFYKNRGFVMTKEITDESYYMVVSIK